MNAWCFFFSVWALSKRPFCWFSVVFFPFGPYSSRPFLGLLSIAKEFSDPSGTIAPKTNVLNAWVELGTASKTKTAAGCPELEKSTFADMHDGDKKLISVT